MDNNTKGFKPENTYITVETDTGKLLLWYGNHSMRDVLLVRASTYGELNDGAIKVFGNDAWIDHVFEKFSNETWNEHYIFLAANLYARGLKHGLLDSIETIKKSVAEAAENAKKNVNDGTKVVAKSVEPKPMKSLDDIVAENEERKEAAAQKEVEQTKAAQKEAQPYESVNGPAHYDGTKCMDEMIALYGRDAVRGFCLCNAYKYRYRAGRKPGNDAAQDMAKAKWYENYVIENKL